MEIIKLPISDLTPDPNNARETNSKYLRRDYSKAIKRMIRELRTYDSFRAGVR